MIDSLPCSCLTEYKPRIPDPHIPVVACEIVQQMIHHLATYCTPNTNCSQDSLQNNEEKDQSLVKTSSVVSTAAATAAPAPQDLASNKFLMADQDAPLDLSVKKVKVENIEQGAKKYYRITRNETSLYLVLSVLICLPLDGVLDLSTKKNFDKGHASLNSSCDRVSQAAHVVKR